MFFIGLLISYLYSNLILPNKEKKYPNIQITIYPILYKSMIIIPYTSQQAIHIHHWIFYIFILLLNLYVNIPQTINGFSFGLIIQGLSYKDYNQILCDNPY